MKNSLGPKTLLLPTPAVLVGTYDAAGQPNIMTAAWCGVACSKPVCVTLALRAATHTHKAIGARKAFTLSVPSERFVREVDYAGMYSGRDENKFETLKFTATKAEHVDAPYPEEMPLVLECALIHTLELGLHTLFVGEVKDVKLDADCLRADGQPDIPKLAPISYAPLTREYYGLGRALGQAFSLGKKG